MKIKYSLPLVMLGMASSLPTAVVADDSSIEEVVVTGQVLYRDQLNALKTPTPIIDVPQSVVVISSEQIESRGYTSITDIVNYVPGLNSSQGEGHRDSVVFRGVRSTADFFVDGVRDDVQYYRPLYNVEQVEVLKGPFQHFHLFYIVKWTVVLHIIANPIDKKVSSGSNAAKYNRISMPFALRGVQTRNVVHNISNAGIAPTFNLFTRDHHNALGNIDDRSRCLKRVELIAVQHLSGYNNFFDATVVRDNSRWKGTCHAEHDQRERILYLHR